MLAYKIDLIIENLIRETCDISLSVSSKIVSDIIDIFSELKQKERWGLFLRKGKSHRLLSTYLTAV